MCGIAGVLGPPERTTGLLPRMLQAIAHRGPDDSGEYVGEHLAFGATRLSIIDIAGGHQPMWADGERVGIAYNGEIYNARELTEDLTRQGSRFRTECDTETVLQLYQAEGHLNLPEMFRQLRGMFALAIYDSPRHRLVLARDPFGIKPLYYRLDSRGSLVAFASEIKSLLADPQCPRSLNRDALVNYLSLQYNPLAETFFTDIYRLPAGSFADVDLHSGHVDIHRYWTYEFDDTTGEDEGILTERIRHTMQESVAHQLISDVPVGAFLSGGVDSAILVTLAQEHLRAAGLGPLKTFTLGYDGLNEFGEAREVADRLGTDHHEITISESDFLNALPDIAWYYDEPVANPSAVGIYFVSQAARQHVSVILSGEGADELFGGYRKYREPFDLHRIRRLPRPVRAVAAWLAKSRINYRGRNYFRRASTDLNNRYFGGGYGTFTPNEVRRLLQMETIADHFRPGSALGDTTRGFDDLSESRRMQLIDINYWLGGDILATADRMSMAHSLELRVPYLDTDVARLSARIPDSLKYRDGTTKWMLRRAFRGTLPESTELRQKLGFPTPLREWITRNPDAMLAPIRRSTHLAQVMDMAFIEELAAKHAQGRIDASRRLFLLIMLAAWLDAFLDGDVTTPPSER